VFYFILFFSGGKFTVVEQKYWSLQVVMLIEYQVLEEGRYPICTTKTRF